MLASPEFFAFICMVQCIGGAEGGREAHGIKNIDFFYNMHDFYYHISTTGKSERKITKMSQINDHRGQTVNKEATEYRTMLISLTK